MKSAILFFFLIVIVAVVVAQNSTTKPNSPPPSTPQDGSNVSANSTTNPIVTVVSKIHIHTGIIKYSFKNDDTKQFP